MSEMKKEKNILTYRNAKGNIPIRITNDYLFKALMQKNAKVCKALTCSLLHLDPETVESAEVTNPIILGESINDKDVILDVNLHLNNNRVVNLEMQVVNKFNWPERSTYYACRNYTSLNKGDDYIQVKPVHQIGILNFTPLPEYPMFYSTYMLSEIHGHHIYTNKFSIATLDLTNIDLATAEDKAYNIDKWALFFRSKTWEDIKMLAEKNEAIDDAATTVYQLSEDERIRIQCQAREDYERDQRTVQHYIEMQAKALEEQTKAFEEQTKAFEEQTKALAEKSALIAEYEARYGKL